MPEWLKDAPLAVLMLVAIGMFLRFLGAERKDRREAAEVSRVAHEKRDDAFEKVVERNTEMLGQTKEVVGANTAFLMKLSDGKVRM